MEHNPVKVEVFDDFEFVISDELPEHPNMSAKIEFDTQDEKGDIPGLVDDMTSKKETGTSHDVVAESVPFEQDIPETEKIDIRNLSTETDKPYPMILYKVETPEKIHIGDNNDAGHDDFEKRTLKIVDDGKQSLQCTLHPNNSYCDNSQVSPGQTEATEKLYTCSLCLYSTTLKGNLKKHQLTHSVEKPYNCSMCPYSSAQRAHLKHHELTHTSEKPYKCSLCQYASTRKDNLKQHELTHSSEKPYKCSVCSYSCAWKLGLKRHQLSHTDEKPYKCSLCLYSTTRKRNLKQHELTHSGEKPYKCSVCPYYCARRDNLKKHELTHSCEKPHKCSLCSYRCLGKGSIMNHQ